MKNGYSRFQEALKVALVVGTILNLINQHDALLWADHPIQWGKLALSYATPAMVSLYSSRPSHIITTEKDA